MAVAAVVSVKILIGEPMSGRSQSLKVMTGNFLDRDRDSALDFITRLQLTIRL
jgi:hypothetical protein